MQTMNLRVALITFSLAIGTLNGNAQLGGLKKVLDKTKDKSKDKEQVEEKGNSEILKGGERKFSEKFVERYYLALRRLTSGYLDQGEERLALSKTLSPDSAKMCYQDILNNEKKYSKDGAGFKEAYEKFDEHAEFGLFENSELKKKFYVAYSPSTKFNSEELVFLKSLNNTFIAIKGFYSKEDKLAEMLQKIDTRKKEYIQVLQANNEIMCADQLDAYHKYYFSDKKNSDCIKGKENIKITATDNGVYIAIFSDHYQHIENTTELFVNGKKIGSLSNLNYHKIPTEKGWTQILLLPGLKNVDDRSYSRLMAYANAGLTPGCTVELKHDYYGLTGSFVYDLSGYTKDFTSYLAEIKTAYLKTVTPKTTTYRNAAVEKEAMLALTKFEELNPQYKIGKAVKVFVAGDYWETKKHYNGTPNYQQTNAYYYTKGDDGNCYVVRYTITKNYDVKTSKYEAIKISGYPEKTEVLCDYVK